MYLNAYKQIIESQMLQHLLIPVHPGTQLKKALRLDFQAFIFSYHHNFKTTSKIQDKFF